MNWRVAAGWAKKSSGPEAKMIVKVWEARSGLEHQETVTTLGLGSREPGVLCTLLQRLVNYYC